MPPEDRGKAKAEPSIETTKGNLTPIQSWLQAAQLKYPSKSQALSIKQEQPSFPYQYPKSFPYYPKKLCKLCRNLYILTPSVSKGTIIFFFKYKEDF